MIPENPKKFDQAFKSLPEASPRGFAEVMGVVEPGADVDVELLPTEVSTTTVSLDTGLLVRPARASPFVAIFEAFGSYRKRSLEQVLRYNMGLDGKHDFDLRTYMVPLVERALPRRRPVFARRVKGDYDVRVRLRWILPWTIDAAVLLAQGRPEFDAFIPLFRASEQQQELAVERLRGDRNQLARYKILGGLRYRGREAAFWTAFVERMNRMLTKEELRESLAVQEWLDEGRREGRRAGRREAAEEFLRTALASRFPSLSLPDRIPPDVDLVSLVKEILAATGETAALELLSARGLDSARS